MLKNAILISILVTILLVPSVNAQSNSSTDSANTNKSTLLMERKENLQELELLIKKRQDAKRLEIQIKRNEFKANIAKLRDERKAKIVVNIDNRLTTLNQKAIDKLTKGIERLQTLLDKFSSRIETAKTEGIDTSEADAAIIIADKAIEDAKLAVADQAANVYVAEIVDENTLKESVGDVMSKLRADLKATFDIVKIAKVKVMDVARASAKIRKENETKNATQSAVDEPNFIEKSNL